jgi:hypothetical protein
MTVRELKSLIRDSIYEIVDPDYGLELRHEAEASLKKSLKSKKRTSVEKVAATFMVVPEMNGTPCSSMLTCSYWMSTDAIYIHLP